MSKYEFVVKTYTYDSTGYYIGYSNELTISLTAQNTEEARRKALDMRKSDLNSGGSLEWGAKVLSAKEVEEAGYQQVKADVLALIERDWGKRCTTKDVDDFPELHEDQLFAAGDPDAGRCPVCLVYEKFDKFWDQLIPND